MATSGGEVGPTQFADFLVQNEEFLEANASGGEAKDLWDEYISLEPAHVRKQDAVSVVEGLYSLLTTFDCTYTVNCLEGGDAVYRCRFVIDGSKLRYSRKLLSGTGSADRDLAFDGELCRSYLQSRQGGYIGSIEERNGMGDFFDLDRNILAQCMLLPIENLMGISSNSHDLRMFLGKDGCDIVGGLHSDGLTPCIVASNVIRDVYLDPEKSLALTKYVCYFGNELGFTPQEERRFGQFRKLENGIWFPFDAEVSKFELRDSVVVCKHKLRFEVEDVSIGSAISNDVFVSIFPESALVHDETKGVAYYMGEDGAIEATLDRSMLPSRSQLEGLGRPTLGLAKLWIIVGNAAVFLLIVGAYKMLRK